MTDSVTGWTTLTRIPLKASMYERETYFREGWACGAEVAGGAVEDLLWYSTFLMMKPDGLVAGKTGCVCRFLEENGFDVVGLQTPVFTPFVWRELWRYQLTCATLDRLAVNDIVLRGACLLLLLRKRDRPPVPASVLLSGLKGSADVSQQTASSLRAHLDQPNRVLSYIHVCDEPADLVRELAILLEPVHRREAFAALCGPGPSAVTRLEIRQAVEEADRGARVLDYRAAVGRVAEVAATAAPSPACELVRETLRRIGAAERIAWHPFVAALDEAGITVDRWDLATIGTHVIVYDEPGASKQIVNVEAELWRSSQHG